MTAVPVCFAYDSAAEPSGQVIQAKPNTSSVIDLMANVNVSKPHHAFSGISMKFAALVVWTIIISGIGALRRIGGDLRMRLVMFSLCSLVALVALCWDCFSCR